ncbi:glycosyltransferase family 2 protein [Cetobacterium sp.]|uniref:glycosyltransferase family 2 protein n=1 Tax=Cetobacterium sp. TaxID=2071632 RepID=UPI003F33F887
MESKKITVFTATYNRGYIIENLYNSLKNQTNKNFEWIVIDDGSTDNTEDLFKGIEKEKNEFEIKYIKKENGGKHRAINLGVEIALGELFFIVDSDDVLTKNAIEKVIFWENTISNNEKYAGIAGNRGFEKDKLIGKTFLGEYVDATSLERKKYEIYGDKAEVFYTKVLKKFKFPEYRNENFITESVVWYEIASKGYKIRWFNEIIYLTDYLEDGLTKSGKDIFIKNPKGYGKSIQINTQYLNEGFTSKLLAYNNYYQDMKKKLSLNEIRRNLNISFVKLYLSIVLGIKYSLATYYYFYKNMKDKLSFLEIKTNLKISSFTLYLSIILGKMNSILKRNNISVK